MDIPASDVCVGTWRTRARLQRRQIIAYISEVHSAERSPVCPCRVMQRISTGMSYLTWWRCRNGPKPLFISLTRTSQHFMKLEGSLTRSQFSPSGPNPPIYSSLRSITILSFHLYLDLPTVFPSRFPTANRYEFHFSSLPNTWHYPTYLIFLDVIIPIIFGEQYKSLISSWNSFSQPPVTSSS
jgi:hypothetical protein